MAWPYVDPVRRGTSAPSPVSTARIWLVAFGLWCLRSAARSGAHGAQILFSLHVRNDNREGTLPLVSLKAICGPGDDAEPVITVLLLCS